MICKLAHLIPGDALDIDRQIFLDSRRVIVKPRIHPMTLSEWLDETDRASQLDAIIDGFSGAVNGDSLLKDLAYIPA